MTKECNSLLNDSQFKLSRRFLITVSLLLLIVTLGEAEVDGVNTILFKLSFSNPGALYDLLLISNGYLLIRYYNSAAKYHEQIFKEWTKNLFSDYFMYRYDPHNDHESGFLVDFSPKSVPYNHFYERHNSYSTAAIKPSLTTNLLLNCEISFSYSDENGNDFILREALYKNSSLKNFIKVQWLIMKYWWDAQFRSDMSLTIHAPYLIAIIAISTAISHKVTMIL